MAEDKSVDEGKEGDDADGGFRVIAVFESAVIKRVGNHRLGQILPGTRRIMLLKSQLTRMRLYIVATSPPTPQGRVYG